MRGKCELCGERTNLEKHHVWGGARRNKADKLGAVAFLCESCHREGRDAVHKCGATAFELKAKTQARVMREQGWTTDDFIRELGRNYI